MDDIEDILKESVSFLKEATDTLKSIDKTMSLGVDIQYNVKELFQRVTKAEKHIDELRNDIYPTNGKIGLFERMDNMQCGMISMKGEIISEMKEALTPIKIDLQEQKEESLRRNAIEQNKKETVSYASIIIGIGASVISTLIAVASIFLMTK